MKLKVINKMPTKNYVYDEIEKLVKEFEGKPQMFMEIALNEEERKDIDKTYNAVYQVCKKNTRVKVKRCCNLLYLVKVDENGEEL